jgi:hypothetical protein
MSVLGNNLLAQYYAQNNGKRKFAELGYVTDGIVECWDGEYNLGVSHSSDSTIWLDMIHGATLTYVGLNPYVWIDKCCRFSDTHGYGAFIRPQDKSARFMGTIELASCCESFIGTNAYPINAASIFYANVRLANVRMSPTIVNASILVGNMYSESNTIQNNFDNVNINNITTASILYDETNGSMTAYRNARAKTSTWTGQASYFSSPYMVVGSPNSEEEDLRHGGAGRIYNIRIYNRLLTQAEISKNYAIDRERFGTLI